MSAYLYILEDRKNKFYVGSTNNLERRMREHRSGGTQTTNRMDNPVLVFSKKYDTLTDARNSERYLKKLKRKDYLRKIIKDGFMKK